MTERDMRTLIANADAIIESGDATPDEVAAISGARDTLVHSVGSHPISYGAIRARDVILGWKASRRTRRTLTAPARAKALPDVYEYARAVLDALAKVLEPVPFSDWPEKSRA
jgi:hypothetical protein